MSPAPSAGYGDSVAVFFIPLATRRRVKGRERRLSDRRLLRPPCWKAGLRLAKGREKGEELAPSGLLSGPQLKDRPLCVLPAGLEAAASPG